METAFPTERHILSDGQTLYPIRFLTHVRLVIQCQIQSQEACQTHFLIRFPTLFLKAQAIVLRTAYQTVCPTVFLAL